MMNQLKTILLLGALSAILVGIGASFGPNAFWLFTAIAIGMNLVSYFFSDRIVLRMHRARELPQGEAPRLHAVVAELAGRAGIPKPRVFFIDDPHANAFATGRNPEHAVVAVTRGIVGDPRRARAARRPRARDRARREPRHPRGERRGGARDRHLAPRARPRVRRHVRRRPATRRTARPPAASRSRSSRPSARRSSSSASPARASTSPTTPARGSPATRSRSRARSRSCTRPPRTCRAPPRPRPRACSS